MRGGKAQEDDIEKGETLCNLHGRLLKAAKSG